MYTHKHIRRYKYICARINVRYNREGNTKKLTTTLEHKHTQIYTQTYIQTYSQIHT